VASVMTMAVIGIALVLPLLLQVFLTNVRAVTANWNQTLDISVYMNKGAGIARVQAVAKQLRARSDVAAVRVITADEALTEFRQKSGFGGALDALTDNPLPDTLVVTPALTAGTAQAMAALQAAIAATADVQTVQVDTQWVQRLQGMLDVLRRVVWLTSALLGGGIVLVVGNTIRLDILNRRAEIEVMKLVGATDGFTRRPFLYGGVWYGLGGGIWHLHCAPRRSDYCRHRSSAWPLCMVRRIGLTGWGRSAASGCWPPPRCSAGLAPGCRPRGTSAALRRADGFSQVVVY